MNNPIREPKNLTLGESIVVWRMRQHLSQNQLAWRARLSRPTISNIERGVAHPEPATLAAIWKALRGRQ